MQISRNQILVLVSVFAVVIFFTVSGYKSSRSGVSISTNDATRVADLESMVKEEEQRLPDSLLKRVVVLKGSGNDLKRLVVLWDSLGKPLPAAYYMWQLAEKEPSGNNWMVTGSKYYNVAMLSSDTNIFMEAGKHAKSAFAKALELEPENIDAKNALAACYVDVDHDIMKGVGLLKEVIGKDSNNIQATFTLGMLSIQSGQLEKAKQRFEKLIRLQPFNAEYYYYLGEVYAKGGEIDKAIQTYEKCKTLLSDKSAQQEIETIINKLKTI